MKHADTRFQFKSLDDAGHIEGLAAGIGDSDTGGDTILAGAFTKTLVDRGQRPLPMLFQHDQARPIGVWTSWREAKDGLHVKGRLTMATRDAQEAYALARDGALGGISIGYLAKSPHFDPTTGGRQLPQLDLYEASLVTIPMHPRAQVTSVKAITGAGDIADLLREHGLSGRQAKAAAGVAWRSINEHDDDNSADDELAALFAQSTARLARL